MHFIGIGGIGVSAIARMMLGEGKPFGRFDKLTASKPRAREVSGSDVGRSEITDELKKLGAEIFFGHNEKYLNENVDLVVYTPAVSEDNPELIKAKRLGIKTLSYPEMLGIISKEKFTIAVSGSHGKTTTTAMIGTMLQDLQLDPMIIVGSLLKDAKSNFVSGRSKYFVVEACEYKKSFLNINPRIIVITNIDNDHLDYYKNVRNIQKAFSEFVSKLGSDDYLVCNPGGKYLSPVIESACCNIIDYTKIPRDFNLKLIGEHNLDNAQAAFAVARVLKTQESRAWESLENFEGTWRRFEYKGKTKNGALVYDDYGHHPTEIRATLAGARKHFSKNKIFCVFQPHLYSRTKLLMNEFVKSFGDADTVLVADIYAAREKNEGTHSIQLVSKIKNFHKNVRYVKSFDDAGMILILEPKNGDIILTMGAGDVYKIGEILLKK